MTTKRKATGIKKQTFRSAYNLGNEDYSQSFSDGLTEQHHTDTCDINKILAQFMETGICQIQTQTHNTETYQKWISHKCKIN